LGEVAGEVAGEVVGEVVGESAGELPIWAAVKIRLFAARS
jgi:hypothetical protein